MMKRIIIICLSGLCFLYGCTKDMSPGKTGNSNSPRKVLIAGYTSEFKEKVITKVIETLKSRDYYIEIASLDTINEKKTGQYGVILFISMIMGGKIDRRITRFLEQEPVNPNVIVFYTAGSENHPPPEWVKQDFTIDTVTSASIIDRVEERADQLTGLIEKRFETEDK